MIPGIFARTFQRPDLDGVLDAIAGHDIRCVQFNLACAGLPSLPDSIPTSEVRRIRNAFASRDLEMSAISGTCNLIHPDPQERSANLKRLATLANACAGLETSVITLCTGTRDPHDMWRAHPENDSQEAWEDLLRSMEIVLSIAERAEVVVAIEPEISNVVSSAVKARALLNHFEDPRLRIVMDPANLFPSGTLPRMREIIEEAFRLLGEDIVIAHAKDLTADGDAGHAAAGSGLLDYGLYLRYLHSLHYEGPILLHSLSEEQVPAALDFLRTQIRDAQRSSP